MVYICVNFFTVYNDTLTLVAKGCNCLGLSMGLPDSEVENTGDSKKIVIFMQDGIGHYSKIICRNTGYSCNIREIW